MEQNSQEASKFVGNPRDNILSRKKSPRLPRSDDVLVSGDSARHSGLYTLEHNSHADVNEHEEIFIRKGTLLPPCPECENPIKFRLLKKMAYIAEDPDFQ